MMAGLVIITRKDPRHQAAVQYIVRQVVQDMEIDPAVQQELLQQITYHVVEHPADLATIDYSSLAAGVCMVYDSGSFCMAWK